MPNKKDKAFQKTKTTISTKTTKKTSDVAKPRSYTRNSEAPPTQAPPTPPISPTPTQPSVQTPEGNLQTPGAFNEDEVRNNQPIDLGRNNDIAKNKAGKEGLKTNTRRPARQAISDASKKASEAIRQGIKKIATQISTKLAVAIGPWGWAILIGAIIITAVVILFFVFIYAISSNGYFGKTWSQLASSGSAQVQKIITDSSTAAGGVSGTTNSSSYHKFDFLNATDKKAVQDGKIDKRLLTALDYLTQKHNRIAVSHFIDTYKDMPTDPESSDQLSQNVSAHKQGLAADVSQIDFVTKSIEPSSVCTDPQLNDIVYLGDGMPTTDPSTIGQSNTPASTMATASTLQNTNSALNQINTNNNLQATAQLNNLKNQVNGISQTLNNNSNDLKTLQTNVTAANSNIANVKNTINSSALSADQKAAMIKQLSTVTTQLSALTNKYNQLGSLMSGEQTTINNMTNTLSADTSALSGNIDAINKEFTTITNNLNNLNSLQNVSVLHDLGAINSQLSNFNNDIANAGALGNDLSGLTGILGSSNELLRLYCLGGPTTGPATKEAIPIKVLWQDDKPDIAHVSADVDDCTTHETIAGPIVCYSVFRPQAQIKVHQVITELLQFPYDMKAVQTYKINQLITFSQTRDVDPFSAILNKIYGVPRPGNFGLFSMPESWAQVHVGY